MEPFKLGLIGLGLRGEGWLNYLVKRDDVQVAWICDIDEEKVLRRREALAEKGIHPNTCTDFHEMLSDKSLNGVFIAAAWEAHIPLAIASMESGIPTALEVGGAYALNDCYRLVETQEKTGTFFMFMENCCYGRREMMALHLVNQGTFGDVVHCTGGYCHDLRDEIARGAELKHYRLRNYLNRCCDNYPTHALLPIMKLLGINDGNRMVSLVSMASSAKGLAAYSRDTGKGAEEILSTDVTQGDVVNTIIRCAKGETILLTLETTLPRFYSRKFSVHGTKGIYTEDCDAFYFDDEPEHRKNEWNFKPQYKNAEQYQDEFDHPLWKKTLAEGLAGGHGGMDGLVMDAFIRSVQNGWESPIDVYDAAACMCLSPLSENAIATGGSVYIPDFTDGRYLTRTHGPDTPYTLRRK